MTLKTQNTGFVWIFPHLRESGMNFLANPISFGHLQKSFFLTLALEYFLPHWEVTAFLLIKSSFP